MWPTRPTLALLALGALAVSCNDASQPSAPPDQAALDDSGGDSRNEVDSGAEGETGTGAGGGETAEDTAGADAQVFASLITVSEPVDADLSCYTPGGTCLRMRAFEECVASRSIVGQVVDEATGVALPGARVRLFWGDALEESADADMVADAEGRITGGSTPTCIPLTWRVQRDDKDGGTVVHHQMFSLPEDPEQTSVEGRFTSTSSASMAALLAPLSLAPDPASGVITGRITDCAAAPILDVQVIVSRFEGGYPEQQVPFYFGDQAPEPDRRVTGASGRWGVAGLAPGRYYAEIWARVQGYEEILNLSFSEVDVVAGGITTIEMQSGIAGAVFPDACLDPCE